MITRFICLANSLKEGGRCLAGIELDNNNLPVKIDGKPKWIRPVCHTAHGEVPNIIAAPFCLLNIIDLELTGPCPHDYQSENVNFNQTSLQQTGDYKSSDLANTCNNEPLIFGNRGKAVSQEKIGDLHHSLMLISVSQFEVTQTYDIPDKPKLRLEFSYNGNNYNFPITDPVFMNSYVKNKDLLKGIQQLFLTLSLSVAWKDWYYKLIAGIIAV